MLSECCGRRYAQLRATYAGSCTLRAYFIRLSSPAAPHSITFQKSDRPTAFGPSSTQKQWDTAIRLPHGTRRRVPAGNSEWSVGMSTNTAAVSIVAIVCFCLLAAYTVHTTGSTAGITDLGRVVADIVRAVADIIAAATGRHS